MVYSILRGKIAGKKKLHKLTNADIARKTGYSKSAIEAFMCGVRESDNIAKAVASVLDIEI